ncbi:DNA-binding response regulator, NarL/FixJ family, contains REC and HTH domains [Sinosporangium album]|uniref:DNA-binding response regulator, NarL/FixJ family, contains REC and HTH domains n=1 Tax=Sinosporangium album TaxID=504805 RepID=A0A1G8HPE2_9ACTN|nr:response regulator transcription factor [Sinosporangium album]SDI08380.1 DNA-binding response regulator, NarL/FixJ family, contains REC and HTH domains [Sinosporangium album]
MTTPIETSAPRIGVMLVDDQRLARTGFALMLRKAPDIDVIAEAGNGQEALDVLAQRARERHSLPDVVLMDVRMPEMDGIEATRQIGGTHPAVKVLVLTTYDEDDYAFGALAAGASGFLLKDVRTPQLIAAIQAVAQGDAILTPRVTRQVIERGIPRALPVAHRECLQTLFRTLSPRETDIARLIADGLSNAEIADRLVIQQASVRRNVSRILAKLRLRDRVQIAVEWHKSGM